MPHLRRASHSGEKDGEIRILTDAHSPFERRKGPGQVALAEGQQTEPVIGPHKAAGVIDRLGDPQPFFPQHIALGERAQLSMTRGKEGTGVHGGQEDLTEALAAPRALEGRHGLPKAVECPTVVALGMVGCAEGLVRQRLQDGLPAGRGERQDTLGGGDGLVIRARDDENA